MGKRKVSRCLVCGVEIRTGATMCTKHSRMYYKEKNAVRSRGKSPLQIVQAIVAQIIAKSGCRC